MNNDLYFIPIIQSAFDNRDDSKAFVKAFDKIAEIGAQTNYQQGLKQFHAFMAETRVHLRLEMDISRDDIHLQTIYPESDGRINLVEGVIPGFYKLSSSTGWVLWQDEIRAEEVFWSRAFPGQKLDMAADTIDAPRRFSRREHIIDNQAVLYIFPGIDNACMGIELQ